MGVSLRAYIVFGVAYSRDEVDVLDVEEDSELGCELKLADPMTGGKYILYRPNHGTQILSCVDGVEFDSPLINVKDHTSPSFEEESNRLFLEFQKKYDLPERKGQLMVWLDYH